MLSKDELIYILSDGGRLEANNAIEYAYFTISKGRIMYNNDEDPPSDVGEYLSFNILYSEYLRDVTRLKMGRMSRRYIDD